MKPYANVATDAQALRAAKDANQSLYAMTITFRTTWTSVREAQERATLVVRRINEIVVEHSKKWHREEYQRQIIEAHLYPSKDAKLPVHVHAVLVVPRCIQHPERLRAIVAASEIIADYKTIPTPWHPDFAAEHSEAKAVLDRLLSPFPYIQEVHITKILDLSEPDPAMPNYTKDKDYHHYIYNQAIPDSIISTDIARAYQSKPAAKLRSSRKRRDAPDTP